MTTEEQLNLLAESMRRMGEVMERSSQQQIEAHDRNMEQLQAMSRQQAEAHEQTMERLRTLERITEDQARTTNINAFKAQILEELEHTPDDFYFGEVLHFIQFLKER